jgi:GT2 family glycosyltransferase
VSELGFAIPFYSGLGYLGRAIQSLRAQSTHRWRAVVVDDAGPDPEACELVHDFADPRVRYVRNDANLGLAKNWNRCLELVGTDLVTLLHSDDELGADYAETVLDAHRRHPGAVAVHTRATIIGSTGRRIFSLPDFAKRFTGPSRGRDHITTGDEGLATVLRGQFIFCPALSYKTHLLPDQPFDSVWQQVLDLDLIARLLFEGQRIVGVPPRAYRYRRHPASQTALLTSSRDRFREEFALYDQIARRAEAQGWGRSATVAERARIVRAHLVYRALGSALRGRGREAQSTMSLLRARQ